MIDSLYTKYFQKSRSFLYPTLGIKRTASHSPSGTYLALEDLVGPEDMKLICTYKDDQTASFKSFEQEMLLTNPLFSSILHVHGYNLYLFDFESYQNDWFNVITGKYSQLSVPVKKAIKLYYGEESTEYKYIDTYLHPDQYFDTYAKLLEIEVSVLEKVGELCDPVDMEKETLKIPVEHLENLRKVL